MEDQSTAGDTQSPSEWAGEQLPSIVELQQKLRSVRSSWRSVEPLPRNWYPITLALSASADALYIAIDLMSEHI
jgi:hypothetical protein